MGPTRRRAHLRAVNTRCSTRHASKGLTSVEPGDPRNPTDLQSTRPDCYAASPPAPSGGYCRKGTHPEREVVLGPATDLLVKASLPPVPVVTHWRECCAASPPRTLGAKKSKTLAANDKSASARGDILDDAALAASQIVLAGPSDHDCEDVMSQGRVTVLESWVGGAANWDGLATRRRMTER